MEEDGYLVSFLTLQCHPGGKYQSLWYIINGSAFIYNILRGKSLVSNFVKSDYCHTLLLALDAPIIKFAKAVSVLF